MASRTMSYLQVRTVMTMELIYCYGKTEVFVQYRGKHAKHQAL